MRFNRILIMIVLASLLVPASVQAKPAGESPTTTGAIYRSRMERRSKF